MNLIEFNFAQNNPFMLHFVAMEYYHLIKNRTFLVLLTNDYLIGVQANGLISVDFGSDNYQVEIMGYTVIKGDLQNPYLYVNPNYFIGLMYEDLFTEKLLENKHNFRIARKDIRKVWHTPRKKWGMGNYPHDGRVYVQTHQGKKKELIILGNQSGKLIAEFIKPSNE